MGAGAGQPFQYNIKSRTLLTLRGSARPAARHAHPGPTRLCSRLVDEDLTKDHSHGKKENKDDEHIEVGIICGHTASCPYITINLNIHIIINIFIYIYAYIYIYTHM